MSYTAIVTREGDQWLADVPSVPGAHTFAPTLDELLVALREVVVLMDDLDDQAAPAISMQFEKATA